MVSDVMSASAESLSDPSLDAEQAAAMDAMLPYVPQFGWTSRALRESLRDAGGDGSEAEFRFPGGAAEMIETFFGLALRRAIARAEPEIAGEMRLGKRVRGVVKALLDELSLNKDATRRAIAWLILPRQARVTARMLAALVDGIWHAAGDQSADFSWYTKRASLIGIMLPTLLFWLNDFEAENEASLAFFDRRLADLGRVGAARARMSEFCASLMGPRAGAGRMRA
jgi:ubiquinone biosynthesis protein COQ9